MACGVFISYKREERSRVERLAQKLKTIGLDVWFDTRLASGPSFDAQIASQLKAAKIVLVCWTPGAIGSDWVRAEAAMAHGAGKLVAVFLEPTELIPPFNLVHSENLADWHGEDDHEGWAKILVRIAALSEEDGLVAWSKIMSDGDSRAMRDWIAAQPPGPLRSTMRYWLSEMDGAPVVTTHPVLRSPAQEPRSASNGGRGMTTKVAVLLVLLALVGGGYYAWRTADGAPSEANGAIAPRTSAPGQVASPPASRPPVSKPTVETPEPAPSPGTAVSVARAQAPEQSKSAVVEASEKQQIEIADGTRMRIKANELVDFETGRLTEDDGPHFDFEAYAHGGNLRWKSRGSAKMSAPLDAPPNKRVCAEKMAVSASTDMLMRKPNNYPILCFLTVDGHQGFISALNDSNATTPAEFTVTFFRN